jgi:hypothetical protein
MSDLDDGFAINCKPAMPAKSSQHPGNSMTTPAEQIVRGLRGHWHPFQRRLGLHHRRLLRLIDALERQFSGDGEAGFVVRDHYVAAAHAMELLSSAYRLTKP